MDHKQVDQAEWKNPANWSVGFYFSKKDRRTLVPKRLPWLGWTLNIGQRAGALSMLGVLIVLPVTMAVVMALACGK